MKDKVLIAISGFFTGIGAIYFIYGIFTSDWQPINSGLLMMILGELTDMPKIHS